MKKTIDVVAAIIIDEGKILIAKRAYGEFEGMFEFPGGKVELGETKEEALKREILEELDIEIEIKEYFMCAKYEYETFYLSMDCYICQLHNGDIKIQDHSEIRWIESSQDDIEWIPADIQIIELLRHRGY